jgi:hypothetical protein
VTEVREATVAAEVAAGRLEVARRKLGSACDWATYDTFLGGGLFGDMMKYERMDRRTRVPLTLPPVTVGGIHSHPASQRR